MNTPTKKDKAIDAFLYLVVFMLIQFAVTYITYACWTVFSGKNLADAMKELAAGNMDNTPAMTIVIQSVSSIITLVLFLALRWCQVSRSYLRSRPWAVLFWAGVAALGTIIPSEVFLELVPLPDISGDILTGMMDSQWGYLAICIFAPVVEELVFRGAILRALLNSFGNHWVAIAISAICFSIVHGNPAQMPHAFCLGLLLGWMYYRTRSVVPGIMLHWVNNTLAYAVYNIFPQYADAKVIDMLGSTQRVVMAVVFSLCILIPAILQLHLRMKKAHSNTHDTLHMA